MIEVRLEYGDGSRRLPHRHGIDEHGDVVAVEQLEGEMDTADTEVGDAERLRASDGERGG